MSSRRVRSLSVRSVWVSSKAKYSSSAACFSSIVRESPIWLMYVNMSEMTDSSSSSSGT